MNDIVPRRPVSSGDLRRQGLTAVGCLAAGGLFLVLGALPPVVGIVAGAVVSTLGLTTFCSREPGEKKPGMVITAAGLLGILSKVPLPLVKPVAGFALSLAAAGLLALGLWNGIRFVRGLKSRS